MEKIVFVKIKQPWCYNPYSDPPLGLLSVAAQSKRLGLDTILLDQAHEKEIPPADYYGLSATTLEYPVALEQARRIKEVNPDAKIIAGGVHFDVLPEEYWKQEIKNTPIDIVCRGEGEGTLAPAIESLRAGNTKQVISRTELLDLDTLPLPARELLDKEKYFVPGKTITGMDVGGNSSTIMVSRGCYRNCSFCASPALHHRKVRFRSLENTLVELEHLRQEYGVAALRWQDDNIPLNLKKYPALVPFLEKLGIYSRGSARTDAINPQMLDLMWKAGFREIGFGVEAAEQQVLNAVSKGTTIEQNRKALKDTKERDFKTRAFIMTGLPGETRDSGDRMIEFLQDTQPDVVTLTSFIPLPGSDIYMHPEKYGVKILTHDWSKYDIMIKWNAGTAWTHSNGLTLDEMETNREKLKKYIFNQGICNVPVYNKRYG